LGKVGGVLLIALGIAMLGYYVGYRRITRILDKIISYAVQVKKSNELKTLFVSSVSHEIRNPLAILRTNLFTIGEGQAGEVTGEQKKILETCYNTTKRISRLADDLLNLYKIESGMITADIKEHDTADMINNLVRENEILLDKNGIKLSTNIEKDVRTIRCDEDKILQVMNNLLNNAIKYTPENGRINFRVIKDAAGVKIECEDNGAGIPEDKIGKIFDKFERLGSKKEGIGLGLAISKNIVELHGGKIWAESQLGKGTKLTVLLPFDPKKA
ncbi:MAG: HAMP domain-containing histidine kinase, partial [Candidatus Omnitrophica bacterium]|nr:HAMP domain-containing histidine kinase [Candidatus Omnitrophota bacterium]